VLIEILDMTRSQYIGGIAALSEIIQETVIPFDKLDGAIARLRAIKNRHAVIDTPRRVEEGVMRLPRPHRNAVGGDFFNCSHFSMHSKI
jgi:hypothetical protein